MPTDGHALPDPKPARVPRKPYRRQVASRKTWARIVDAKLGPCRVCVVPHTNGHAPFPRHHVIEFHHVVSRSHGGADTEANIVPVCRFCHASLTARNPNACADLLASLTEAEYAYMIQRGGEDYPERAYGIRYRR